MKRNVLKEYEIVNGKIDPDKPIYVEYDIEDKIEYYKKRKNDYSLTKEQRYYADKKYKMLTTGKGRIYVTEDEYFKGGKGKHRRVMLVGTNNDNVMINKIYGSKAGNRIELSREDVPILQKESYLEQDSHIKKKHGGLFSKKDLTETTSTINPYDYDKVMKFIFKNTSDSKLASVSKNNCRIGKDYK